MSKRIKFGFNTIHYRCKRFSEACDFLFGIHCLFLVKYKDLWKCLTPYDFCNQILIREWGLEKDEQFEKIVNDYLFNIPEEDHIRIVYPNDGYYPGESYEK